jgi:hypothetical protein
MKKEVRAGAVSTSHMLYMYMCVHICVFPSRKQD